MSRRVIDYVVNVADNASSKMNTIGTSARDADAGLDDLAGSALSLATGGMAKAATSILAVDAALIAMFHSAASAHLEIANLQVKFDLTAAQAETLSFAASATGMEMEELANKVPTDVLDEFNGAVGRFVDTTGQAREQAFGWRATTAKLGLVLRTLGDQMLIAFGPGMQRDLNSIGMAFLSMKSSISQVFATLELFSNTFITTVTADWQFVRDLLADPLNAGETIANFKATISGLDEEFATGMARISENAREEFAADIEAWEKLGTILGKVTGQSFAEAVEPEIVKATKLGRLGKAQDADVTSEFGGISASSGIVEAAEAAKGPGLAEGINNVNTVLSGGLTSMLSALGPAGAIAGAVIGLLQNLDGIIEGLVDALINGILGSLKKLPGLIVTIIGEVIPDFIVELINALPEIIPELILALLEAGWMLLKAMFTEIPLALLKMIPKLITGLVEALNPIKQREFEDKKKFGRLFEILNRGARGVGERKSDIALAAGGIVTRPTHALVGEAGPEAVIPLDKMGSMMGGSTTINIGTYTGTDEGLRDLMREIRRTLGSRGLGEAGLA